MTVIKLLRTRLVLLAICSVAASAQSPEPAVPTTVPALFLSDVHLDPFADPALVAKLNDSPADIWPAILSAPASPTQAQDLAALQKACPTRGTDTSYDLWRSSLASLFRDPTHVRFVTLSGDLLAHSFDCKYKALLPKASAADYTAFTVKTIQTIANTLHYALPSAPLYIAMGNNDSGCTDYALDASHDAFLAKVAEIVATSADPKNSDRASIQRDFAVGGEYSIPIAGVPNTRLLVIDDLFLSGKYSTCAGKSDPAPAVAQLAWLASQLTRAREHGERIWVMGHIPPGVDLYATARKSANICGGTKPQMFLANESLADLLAANADIVRLALFGHTHADELRLLTPASAKPGSPAGVPLKVVASITPINGNRPTYTLASIDPTTSSLADYTVVMASNSTGNGTTWAPEYTFSSAYNLPAFDAPSLATLIPALQADSAARTPASQSYLQSYFPGDISPILKLAWPQYACSLNHDSAAAFSACACPTRK